MPMRKQTITRIAISRTSPTMSGWAATAIPSVISRTHTATRLMRNVASRHRLARDPPVRARHSDSREASTKSSPMMPTAIAVPPSSWPGMSPNREIVSALVKAVSAAAAPIAVHLGIIGLEPLAGHGDGHEQQADERTGHARAGHEQVVEALLGHVTEISGAGARPSPRSP